MCVCRQAGRQCACVGRQAVCMYVYVCYVCMLCMLCMYVMYVMYVCHVCIYVCYVCMLRFFHEHYENTGFRRLSLRKSYSALKISTNRPNERPGDDI